MSTFDIKEYIAQIAQSVLSLQPDYDFQLTEVSGLAGFEGIISGQVAFDNFIATDSTGDGYVYQQPNGGYFMRRVATVFIMRKYQYMDMAAMREEVEKCRRYFNLIVAQMVADQPNLETKLIYLNTERIVIREFEPETSAHFTGLYFMLEFSQPYSLVAAPPVEKPFFEFWIQEKIDIFSFVVNEIETITIPVNQYHAKWIVDRPITSLKNCLANNALWKEVKIKGLQLNFSLYSFAQWAGTQWRHYIDISECSLETYDYYYFSGPTLATIYAPAINSSLAGFLSSVSNLIATDDVKANLSIGNCSGMSKEGVLSLINYAARNNTYTLHATVYNKCATGGEWHADVQAALDAKAAEGFTVTLISA